MSSDFLSVRAWEEAVVIPTYPVGKPEKNPMFLEKRIYQGSSGVVYPYPVIEKISDEKIDKVYQAIFLENEYLKIMVLPELGGRIQMAYDKIAQRHFIYYNQVIKPALVGLTGPWISGGIEFNWPQHHRPTTFDPIDHTIEEHSDGSKTVWVNELERMSRTKGMAGFTLYPGKAYLEVKGKIYNRTPFPQSFLWWANPAVKVNDHYQSVFPPDVNAVYDHGKRDVSSFPIATGSYYKVDYSPGTDISFYKNIPVPTSFMAVHSDYDFIGGYEHDMEAGMLHVADHFVSPGKKQWTWGNGEFGKAWDKNLTDEDGPYVELMTGVYTENQPDFSWINPYEEKSFTQYFMPYQKVGVVKNATREAVVGVERINDKLSVKLYVTSANNNLQIRIDTASEVIISERIFCSPAKPFIETFDLKNSEDFHISVINSAGRVLVEYRPVKEKNQPIPEAALKAAPPSEIQSAEQLYLTGLHLEQYRHATFQATDYYKQGLVVDPKDIRCNNAMGLWLLKRGKFMDAIPYFSKAVETLTERNLNPYDGEPFFNLGTAYLLIDQLEKAEQYFQKSVWNDAWQHAGYLNLARIACRKNDWEKALSYIEKSLLKNRNSHSANHIKSLILRKLERFQEAALVIEESLKIDQFNYGCLYEKVLIEHTISSSTIQTQNNLKPETDEKDLLITSLSKLVNLSRNWEHNFIEYAWDYGQAGCYAEAIELLKIQFNGADEKYPMIAYNLAWFNSKINKKEEVRNWLETAAGLLPDGCFPNRIEDVGVLQFAIDHNSSDNKAPYYLGNYWYDKRCYSDAIECWKKSVAINDKFATVHRNLALACFNKLNDHHTARKFLERAFELDVSDARVFMELDQLYKRLNVDPAARLSEMNKYPELVNSRDDLYLERITLLNQEGEYREALGLLKKYKFHPWEGGEGKVVKQWTVSNISLAKEELMKKNPAGAIEYLHATFYYPENLGEGKLVNTPENETHYLLGVAYELLNEPETAKQMFELATAGDGEPVQAIFYNDPQPDYIFYKGLAYIKLSEFEKAESCFRKLISFGELHLNDKINIDYFAVSLPDLLVFDSDLDEKNRIHCLYMQALGYTGLGEQYFSRAITIFNEVLSLDCNHSGAVLHSKMINESDLLETTRKHEV
jgi:tetratricopeptide (TPR) repeat protein